MKIPDYDEAEYHEERLAEFKADDTWPFADEPSCHVWSFTCWLDEHGRVVEKAP